MNKNRVYLGAGYTYTTWKSDNDNGK